MAARSAGSPCGKYPLVLVAAWRAARSRTEAGSASAAATWGAVHDGHAEVRVERGGLEQAREEAVGPVHGRRRRAVRDDAGGGPLTAFRHALVAQS